MLKILKDGKGKWTGEGNGYLVPSWEEISKPSREGGFIKVYNLLLLQGVLIWYSPDNHLQPLDKKEHLQP